MIRRKQPARHRVHTYKREGKSVRTHMRGHGTHTAVQGHTKLPKYLDDSTKFPSPEAFTVNFVYSKRTKSHKETGESVVVIAESYEKALDEAFEARVQKSRTPIEIELVDPNIGAAISFLSGAIKSAAGIGARFAVGVGKAALVAGKTMVKAGADEGLKAISHKLYETKVRNLIKDAYSPDPVKRGAVRASIKQNYPDIYEAMDFSRSMVPQSSHGLEVV